MRGHGWFGAVVVLESGQDERAAEGVRDGARSDDSAIDAALGLEQERQRFAEDSFIGVVAGCQRHVLELAAGSLAQGGEYVSELGGDDEHPFGVGLGRHDLQQEEPLTGAGRGVGGDRGGSEF
jgi:hypothetical protein